jgi:hypothetical protein
MTKAEEMIFDVLARKESKQIKGSLRVRHQGMTRK